MKMQYWDKYFDIQKIDRFPTEKNTLNGNEYSGLKSEQNCLIDQAIVNPFWPIIPRYSCNSELFQVLKPD